MKKNLSSLILLMGAFFTLGMTTPGCKSKTSDTDIKTSVQTALNADPKTSGLSVDVRDGVATLSGQVSDASAQAAAATIAGGVKGVKSVQNNVTVASAPVEITDDTALTTSVNTATKDFPGVTTTVRDGVIYVTGELKSDDWKRLKMALDALNPKRVDASGLKIS